MPDDERAALVDAIADHLMKGRKVPVERTNVQVTPSRDDAAPTVVLLIKTRAGQKITATFNDDPSDDPDPKGT